MTTGTSHYTPAGPRVAHVSQAGGSSEPFLNFLARGFAALVLTLVLIVGLSPMVCFAVIQMWG